MPGFFGVLDPISGLTITDAFCETHERSKTGTDLRTISFFQSYQVLFEVSPQAYTKSKAAKVKSSQIKMPGEKYKDWWFEDLPEECKKAAAAMGYVTMEHWDEDKPVPFDNAKFEELTMTEKRAAWFLGWNVIDKKLDIWWEDTDEGELLMGGEEGVT